MKGFWKIFWTSKLKKRKSPLNYSSSSFFFHYFLLSFLFFFSFQLSKHIIRVKKQNKMREKNSHLKIKICPLYNCTIQLVYIYIIRFKLLKKKALNHFENKFIHQSNFFKWIESSSSMIPNLKRGVNFLRERPLNVWKTQWRFSYYR